MVFDFSQDFSTKKWGYWEAFNAVVDASKRFDTDEILKLTQLQGFHLTSVQTLEERIMEVKAQTDEQIIIREKIRLMMRTYDTQVNYHRQPFKWTEPKSIKITDRRNFGAGKERIDFDVKW
jgi:hypothetical protein